MNILEWILLIVILVILTNMKWSEDYSKIMIMLVILFIYNNMSLILLAMGLMLYLFIKSTQTEKAQFMDNMQMMVNSSPREWYNVMRGKSTESFQMMKSFVNELTTPSKDGPAIVVTPVIASHVPSTGVPSGVVSGGTHEDMEMLENLRRTKETITRETNELMNSDTLNKIFERETKE